ncbi:MAG: class I SAM-dependent methyltransferase [Magnetococcales bacterium]|nr:class I SAM-dependent methyltransferase [Magnetococcales bacterium]
MPGRLLFRLPVYAIYGCEACGVRFADPQSDNAIVYDDRFIHRIGKYLASSQFGFLDHRAFDFIGSLRQKRILDVGCGTGRFLESVRADNEVFGIEISESFRPYLERAGIGHAIGPLEQTLAAIPDHSWDLICLWDVFEHLCDPVATLQQLRVKLSPNGVIVNWTNNYDDLISRTSGLSYRLTGGRVHQLIDQSFHYHGGHNFNFTTRTLDRIYAQGHFRLVARVITDTPADRFDLSAAMILLLKIFYLGNRLLGKGKIVADVIRLQDSPG